MKLTVVKDDDRTGADCFVKLIEIGELDNAAYAEYNEWFVYLEAQWRFCHPSNQEWYALKKPSGNWADRGVFPTLGMKGEEGRKRWWYENTCFYKDNRSSRWSY